MKKLYLLVSLISSFVTSCIQQENDIVFQDAKGNTISKRHLRNVTGKVNYEIMDNQQINPTAFQLHQQARQLGGSGKLDESIKLLEEAIKIQPYWAYPTYDLAYTYLLKSEYTNALKYYKKVNELEPRGFFTTKTAIYTLEGEQQGKFPEGLYAAYLQIEWTNDKNKKMQIAKMITTKVPDFAPAWKEIAHLSNDTTERINAIGQGLSKNPDLDTQGILMINKALILDRAGKKEEAKQILGKMIFSPETTVGNVELAKFSLNSITDTDSK